MTFPAPMSPEAYLAFDAAAPESDRYEYIGGVATPRFGFDPDGRPVAAGASPEHNQVLLNVAVALGPEARRCGARVSLSRQRVRAAGGACVYPDLVLVCGEPVYSDDTPPVLENPSLLVEILSPSTESVDRGRKLTAYTALASVAEYWVVASDAAEITQFVRTGDGWQIRFAASLDAIVRRETLGLDVPLANVYALVEVGEADPYRL